MPFEKKSAGSSVPTLSGIQPIWYTFSGRRHCLSVVFRNPSDKGLIVSIFFILLGKILPLYANIVLGYLASRYLKVDKRAIATLVFYVVGPVVVFSATMSVAINQAVLFLPIFFYFLCSVIALIYLKIYQKQWPDATSNILAFTAGTGNTGYYGIALALVLFEPPIADIFIFTVLASFFYEATSGFYITAKGTFTARESLNRVFRLPALYAFLLALILNVSGVSLPAPLMGYIGQFKVIFSILGMMVIGMGLDGIRKEGGIDPKFLKIALCTKHLLWPLVVWGLILADKTYTHLFNEELYKVMFVFAIVPLAGNTVTLAVLLKAKPEKAAFAVLCSNILSIVHIPLMLTLYQYFTE